MKVLAGLDIEAKIQAEIPESVVESDQESILIDSRAIPGVMRFLKDTPEFDFNYLNNLTAVDYLQYFEVIYNLTSMNNKQTLMVKSHLSGRENLEIPSITHLWQGADVQEREIFDLLGIRFIGHPNLKRIALWEGFEGHPLRQDFL